jgi:hypothetical protein
VAEQEPTFIVQPRHPTQCALWENPGAARASLDCGRDRSVSLTPTDAAHAVRSNKKRWKNRFRFAVSSGDFGKCLIAMARPKRFELLTPRFVVWCSIQLSYGRVFR